MVKQFKTSAHTAYNLNYHIVFCPRRRSKTLIGNIAQDLETSFRETIASLGGQVVSLAIMPDHVHLYVSMGPGLAPHQVVKALKGRSAGPICKKYPQVRRASSLWSRAYYIGSIGVVCESIVKNYIASQK